MAALDEQRMSDSMDRVRITERSEKLMLKLKGRRGGARLRTLRSLDGPRHRCESRAAGLSEAADAEPLPGARSVRGGRPGLPAGSQREVESDSREAPRRPGP